MDGRAPLEANGKARLSISEYLEWSAIREGKHEFHEGQVFAIPAAKVIHNIIAVNVLGFLTVRLRNKPFLVFGSDQRIHIPSHAFFTYPDITVVWGGAAMSPDDDRSVLNPCLLVEVSSPPTREYDREQKFGLYRDIPSLREYVLIDSAGVGVETWRHDGKGHWEPEAFKTIGNMISMPVLGMDLSLSEIYEGTYLAVN